MNLAILQRDADRALGDGEIVTRISAENGLAVWQAYAVGMVAWHVLESNRPVEAIEPPLHRRPDGQLRRVRIELYRLRLATALARDGQITEAVATIDAALSESAQSGRCWFDAELWRVRAELARIASTIDAEAEIIAACQRSISITRMQGARAWELRATVALARHWVALGRHRQAHQLLVHVHGSFTEGLDTFDLREAADLPERAARMAFRA